MGLKNYVLLSLLQLIVTVGMAYMLYYRSKRLRYVRHASTAIEQTHSLLEKEVPTENNSRVEEESGRCLEGLEEKPYLEQRFRESYERYGRLIDLSPQPMVVQSKGKFIFVNAAGVNWLGADSLDELIGRPIYDILPSHEIPKARGRIDYILTHKYGHAIEYEIFTLKGQLIEAEVTGIYDEHTESTVHMFYDITERKKMERALKESVGRYRRLVELSPVAIAVSKDGVLIYLNPSGLKVIGAASLEKLVGTSPWEWVASGEPDWAAIIRKEMLENGFMSPKEVRINRIDGQTIDVMASAIYDNQSEMVEIVFEDITERKQVAQALMESEQLNRQLIEISPVAMLLHKNFRYTYLNSEALALFGATELNEFVGRPVLDVVHEDSKSMVHDYLKEVYRERGTIRLGEHQIIRRNGSVIDVEAITASFPFKGANKASVTIVRDITEQKRAEEDRRYAEDMIRESEDRYFRLQMSLDQFSSDLFGMVKVEELNSRFVREVCQVLATDKVSFIEVDCRSDIAIIHGSSHISHYVLETIREHGAENLPICEIIDTLDGHFVKIGEIHGKSCILCMGENSPFLLVQAAKVWLETISRYVNVLYDNFRVIEDLTRGLERLASQQYTPVWLLRLMFQLSENERKNLAQDLHDSALQEQIIWYRRLDQLITDTNTDMPDGSLEELERIKQGLLDVIYQIRITCNELRPPLLKEVGLERSLEALFELTQLRSNYAIKFECFNVGKVLNDDLLIGLYRIVQEMLANASKHSCATQVIIKLICDTDRIYLNYKDNGIGMNLIETNPIFGSMGVYGIRERVRSMDGEIEFVSYPDNGLNIYISVPFD